MIVAYFVWSTFYAFSKLFLEHQYTLTIRSLIENIISGSYHMWFIPTIIGIYICIPLIKQIVCSKKITKYFLLLSFIFAFLIPQLINLSNDFIGGNISGGMNVIKGFFDEMNMHFVLGYTFYFILGYYLSCIDLTKKKRKVVYILGGIGFISTILLNAIVTWNTSSLCKTYYGNFNINVLFEAVSIFIFFKYANFNNNKINLLISKLSNSCFGVYLVHVVLIDIFALIGFDTLNFSVFISVPVIFLLLIILSFFISLVLNKIPFINKWIV